MSTVKLKEAFAVDYKEVAFYTGGALEWHENTIFCQNIDCIKLLNIQDGTISNTVGFVDVSNTESDHITTFTTDGGNTLVTAHKSGLLRLWSLLENQIGLVKTWKSAHRGPIVKLHLLDDDSNKLASGGADGIVRLWDMVHQTCLCALKGCQGVVNIVQNHLNCIYASGDDGVVNSWDLDGIIRNQYRGHFSKVTGICFFDQMFVTIGRDKVLLLWQLDEVKPIKTIPLGEQCEVMCKLPKKFRVPGFKSEPDLSHIYVATGGTTGQISIWDVHFAKLVYKQEKESVIVQPPNPDDGTVYITHLICDQKTKNLLITTVDHTILLYTLKSFVCTKQFTGFSDEILDLCLIGDTSDTHLVVATNSPDLKVYTNDTHNCQLLRGHDDIILTVAASPFNRNLFVSGAKDQNLIVWRLNEQFNRIECVVKTHLHSAPISSIVWSNLGTDFGLSTGQDLCVKLWQFNGSEVAVKLTEYGHDKEINCVAISPNDRFAVTASQDKTAKLWTLEAAKQEIRLHGVLRGHKRGVWSARFSPHDQIVATASADCTLKIWSAIDCSCLKTFEGHDSSVLRLEFIGNGLQLLSSGSDGLIKLFNVKTGECNLTLEGHEGRIWALTVNRDESGFVTGDSASILIRWRDDTLRMRTEKRNAHDETILNEQEIENLIRTRKLCDAFRLALKLERPLKCLRIVTDLIRNDVCEFRTALMKLTDDQKDVLAQFACDWNTNSRNSYAAQLCLNCLLKQWQCGVYKTNRIRQIVQDTLPYTDRHFKRLTSLLQDLNLVQYTICCMEQK